MSTMLAATVALPLIAAVLAPAFGPRRAGALGAGAAGLAFALALALTVRVATDGPVTIAVTPDGVPVTIGLVADRLAVVLLLLILGVSAVVQVFAGRYLAGDPRRVWFTASTGLLTAASCALATAITLLGLATAWSAAAVGLCLLLATYPAVPAARQGVRRAACAFLVGDAALWAAVALATLRWGDLDLRRIEPGVLAADPVTLTAIAGLVVVAALSRSAQVPLHRWLPSTLAAPTPVSALLHAGVVNAGGVLLVRLHPLVGAVGAAMWLALVAGGVTAVYGTAVMMTRPDVKGALAYSTMGQMGFMIMTCGLGLYAAAVVHLVAHGLYKATLFLASGSALRRRIRKDGGPPVLRPAGARRLGVVAVAAVLPGLLVLGGQALLPHGGDTAGGLLLTVFGWATAAALTWGWLSHRPTVGAVLAALGVLLAVVPAYLLLAHGLAGFVAPTGVAAGPAGGWVVWAAAVCALLLVGAVRLRSGTGRAAALHRALYVWFLASGDVDRPPRRWRRPRIAAAVAAPARPVAVGADS